MKKIKLIVCPVIVAFGLLIMVFKPEVLSVPLVGGFPVGSAVIWLTLICWSLTFLFLVSLRFHSKTDFLLLKTLKVAFVFSALWGFISFFLSGNWAFVFKNRQIEFLVWMALTGVTILLPLFSFIIFLISKIFRKGKTSESAD